MFLNRFSIATRIFAGFAATIFILIAVGAVVTVQFKGIHEDSETMARDVQIVGVTKGYAFLLYELGNRVTRFQETKSDADLKATENATAAAEAQAARVAAFLVSDGQAELAEELQMRTTDLREKLADMIRRVSGDREGAEVILLGANALPQTATALADFVKSLDHSKAGPLAARVLAESKAAVTAGLSLAVTRDLSQMEATRATISKFGDTVQETRALMRELKLPRREQRVARFAGRDVDNLRDGVASFSGSLQGVADSQDMFQKALNGLKDKMSNLRNLAVESQTASLDVLASSANSSMRSSIIMAVAGGLLAIALASLLGRSIVHPIRKLHREVAEMTEDTGALAAGKGNADEVMQLTGAFAQFREQQRAAEGLRREREREQAQQTERATVIAGMTSDFDAQVTHVFETFGSCIERMGDTAASMNENADRTAEQAVTMSSATEEATSNFQSVATAADEMSASFAEIDAQVRLSTEKVNEAVSESRRAGGQVTELAKSADRIGDVVQLINDIAEQTNLLALNATIEAARAGEAGKGFAVVASEVKSLSRQTAKAIEDIERLVRSVQGATRDSVKVIETVTGRVNEVAGVAEGISQAIQDQVRVTREIAQSVESATKRASTATESIASVSEAARASGVVANDVLDTSRELERVSGDLRRVIQKFLGDVQTA